MRKIPRSTRVAIEFIATVGAVVVGVGADHPAIALVLGGAFALVLLLDLFGEAAWNGISSAVVRNALDRGLFAPQDPEADARERQLRGRLRYLVTELDDARRLLEAAQSAQQYWIHGQDRIQTHAWQASEVLISEWPGLGRLYETLHRTYRALRRVHSFTGDESRVAQAGRGNVVKPEDDLGGLLESIEIAEAEVRRAIKDLGD